MPQCTGEEDAKTRQKSTAWVESTEHGHLTVVNLTMVSDIVRRTLVLHSQLAPFTGNSESCGRFGEQCTGRRAKDKEDERQYREDASQTPMMRRSRPRRWRRLAKPLEAGHEHHVAGDRHDEPAPAESERW